VEEIEVQCVDEKGNQLVVEPPEVERFETFTVTRRDRGNLNGTVDCVLLGLGGNLLQRNVIDIAQFRDVEEGARSGGMELDACSTPSCRETISFNVTVSNDGSLPLFITELGLEDASWSIREGLPDSFLPYLAKNPLSVGESTSVVVDLERDLCFGSLSTHTSSKVVAETNTGEICDNDDGFSSSSASRDSGSRDSESRDSDSGDSPPPLPDGTLSPTASPVDEEGTLSRESIFGLVATGIAVELLICMGLYVYYQRWNARRTTGAMTTKKQEENNS
jgi:hypothetical protein